MHVQTGRCGVSESQSGRFGESRCEYRYDDDRRRRGRERERNETTSAKKEERDLYFTVHAQISQELSGGVSRERFFAVSDV
jgi:hypothetical protein